MPCVWDVTSDIRISAFVCDIPSTGDDTLRRFRGAGCHPNRSIALARALTEAAQIRLTYISGNRDDLPSSDYEEFQQEKLGRLCSTPSRKMQSLATSVISRTSMRKT